MKQIFELTFIGLILRFKFCRHSFLYEEQEADCSGLDLKGAQKFAREANCNSGCFTYFSEVIIPKVIGAL